MQNALFLHVNGSNFDDKDLQRLQEKIYAPIDGIDSSTCTTEENIQLAHNQWSECIFAMGLLWQLTGCRALTRLYKIL